MLAMCQFYRHDMQTCKCLACTWQLHNIDFWHVSWVMLVPEMGSLLNELQVALAEVWDQHWHLSRLAACWMHLHNTFIL